MIPGFHQRFVRIRISQRPVGAVAENDVDSGVGQHFGVFAQHPRVGRLVISEQRFVPEEDARFGSSPGRMVVIFHRFGVLPDDFGDVFDLRGRVVTTHVPGQIEDPDELVFFLVAGIFVFANFASERVGRGPRIAVDGLSCRRRCQQQEHSERQTDFD